MMCWGCCLCCKLVFYPARTDHARGAQHGANEGALLLQPLAERCGSSVCLQGGGKRKGAFAIYIEPWHADIFDWLDLRKNHGKEEARARDLFYGLWINDLFMKVSRWNRTERALINQ